MTELEAILLLVVSVGAFIMPFVSNRLNLPSPVAEIIFGLIIGMFFSDIFHKTEVVRFLGELGFIILMYLAGLEINFENIKKLPSKNKFIYISVISLIIIFSIFTVYYLNLPNIYILVLLTTAIGLLFPVLKDLNITSTHFGQTLLIIGSIGEVVSLISITIFFVVYKYGFSKEAFIHLLEIYLFFSFAYILLRLFKLFIWWFPDKIPVFLKSEGVTETSVRANFVNMFIFVALAALLGLEPIIGAFFGGLLFSVIFKEKEQVIEKLSSFGYGFLIPIFFIDVGLRFNLMELLQLQVIYNAVLLSALMLIVRFLASSLLIFANFSFIEMLLTPFTLSIPLTLLVAIATIGYETQMINKLQASTIILTAILTALIYPWIFKNIIKRINFIQK